MSVYNALKSLRPNANFRVIHGNDMSTPIIEWLDVTPKPSDEEISAEVERLNRISNDSEYRRLRQPEYPSIGDQLDDLFHSGAFSPDMAAKIQAIKDKYPKGS